MTDAIGRTARRQEINGRPAAQGMRHCRFDRLGVPDLGQIRLFPAVKGRIPKTEDSLAERARFELSGDFVNGQQVIRKVKGVLKWLRRVATETHESLHSGLEPIGALALAR